MKNDILSSFSVEDLTKALKTAQVREALVAAEEANRKAAEAEMKRQEKREREAKLLPEILEMLNQALILMKDVESSDANHLTLLKFSIEKLASKNEGGARELYDQYYNSNCF